MFFSIYEDSMEKTLKAIQVETSRRSRPWVSDFSTKWPSQVTKLGVATKGDKLGSIINKHSMA
jgi:hypothetical protein